jgi:hypothetical protein
VRRLFLFLCLLGAAAYLLSAVSKLPEGVPESVSVAETRADHSAKAALSSSWGATLRSLRQDREAAGVSPRRTSREPTGSAPTPNNDEHGLQLTRGTQSVAQPHQASTTTTDETEQEAVKWVRMTQTVRMRSQASVTSPRLQSYSAGSKAQIVGRKNGWVQVLDPTTNERGWVYHTYLTSIDAPSAAELVAASKPRPVKVASPTSPKSTRTAQPTNLAKVTKAKRRHNRQAWRAERRRGLGLFKRRKAQRAWALGPAR